MHGSGSGSGRKWTRCKIEQRKGKLNSHNPDRIRRALTQRARQTHIERLEARFGAVGQALDVQRVRARRIRHLEERVVGAERGDKVGRGVDGVLAALAVVRVAARALLVVVVVVVVGIAVLLLLVRMMVMAGQLERLGGGVGESGLLSAPPPDVVDVDHLFIFVFLSRSSDAEHGTRMSPISCLPGLDP